ncbi:unnamed protein product [Moneuplotes crassus]|uniref:Uncharacterized protein n=1 Tax=Euplotes crassus TaxID=5936 RepID=A0AAD1U1B0_EUPCR|nr:unnamed protein product [Moneuplotes crassus]
MRSTKSTERAAPSLGFIQLRCNPSMPSSLMEGLMKNYCVCFRNQRVHTQENSIPKVPELNQKTPQKLNDHDTKCYEEDKINTKAETENIFRIRLATELSNDDSEAESEEFTVRRTQTDLSARRDVVFKAVFRRLRKYFVKDFATISGPRPSQEDYPQRLQEYCKAKFPEVRLDRVSVVFDCIINAKGKLGTIPQEDVQLKEAISKLLHFYSEKKFRLMNDHPEFFHVLLHFIRLENVVRMVFKEQRWAFRKKVKAHLKKLETFATCMLNS